MLECASQRKSKRGEELRKNSLKKFTAFPMTRLIFLLFFGFATPGLAEGVNLTLNFTSEPDDREIFVSNGKKSVTFKWSYVAKPKNDLKFIQFGYLAENGTYQSVVVKEFRSGSVYVVRKFSDEVSRKDRMEAEKNSKAEFTFKNLELKDSGKYFCGIKLGYFGIQHSVVNLLVADLEINVASSTRVMEAWKDHKITLLCVVNVVDGVIPVFEWRRQSLGSVVMNRAKQTNKPKYSTLELYPHFEYEFDDYVCVARTERTRKKHTVVIRRLYEPQAPVDLRESKTFEQDIVYPKIRWTKPKINGGAPILRYIVEFKPVGIPWSKATREYVNDTVYLMKTIKPGKSYDVRVFAKNKVDKSKPSNNLGIKYDATNSEQGSHSDAAIWKSEAWFISLAGLLVYLGS